MKALDTLQVGEELRSSMELNIWSVEKHLPVFILHFRSNMQHAVEPIPHSENMKSWIVDTVV